MRGHPAVLHASSVKPDNTKQSEEKRGTVGAKVSARRKMPWLQLAPRQIQTPQEGMQQRRGKTGGSEGVGEKTEANKGTELKVRDNRKQYVQMSSMIVDVRWKGIWQN